MTLETVEYQHRDEHSAVDEEEQALSDCDNIFGPARTILRRTKNKISMISNELRLREKRKRVLQLCLRKLERIKDSENNLRRSVCIHNTFSRLTADIKQEKRDKERGQNRNQQQQHQQQSYKALQQQNQKAPKKPEKLDFDNLEELCSIEENVPWDPIVAEQQEIEQAFLTRKRKAEVEKALLSYHQLEKRLKSDISNAVIDAFRDMTDSHSNDMSSLHGQCNSNSALLNSFQSNMCGKAAALDSSANGLFQSLVVNRSLET